MHTQLCAHASSSLRAAAPKARHAENDMRRSCAISPSISSPHSGHTFPQPAVAFIDAALISSRPSRLVPRRSSTATAARATVFPPWPSVPCTSAANLDASRYACRCTAARPRRQPSCRAKTWRLVQRGFGWVRTPERVRQMRRGHFEPSQHLSTPCRIKQI